ELSTSNAICITSHRGAEIWFVTHISVEVFVAKKNIGGIAGTVRGFERNQGSAKGDDVSLNSVPILKDIKVDCVAFRRLAKCALLDCAFGLRLTGSFVGKHSGRCAQ